VAVHAVLVSSPGAEPAPHWSHAAAADLAAAFAARGVRVTWLAVPRLGQVLPPAGAAVARETIAMPSRPSLAGVARETSHLALERRLTQVLRDASAAVVVHVGLGARGSPNVCWLAERLGALPSAVVHAAEVVCHRGDLVDHRGAPCGEFLQPDRCRQCCRGALRLPAADAFRNRSDLLAASLLACRNVFVPAPPDVAQITAFGVTARALVADATADTVVGRLLA